MPSDLEAELRAETTRLQAQLRRERRARRHRLAVGRMAAETSAEVTRHGVAEVIAAGASDIFGCHWAMVAFVGDDDVITFVHGPDVPHAIADDWTQAPLGTAVPIAEVLRGEHASIALPDRRHFRAWPILVDEADRFEIGSLYVEALPGDERPHAAVALAWTEAHAMDETERDLLDELIDASTPAFARAISTEVDRELVSTLQNWLLPAEVPVIEGLDVATLYEPGRVAMEVGGDWYDVVQLGEGRSSIVVGDVVGHDARAAAEMGQVRHVLAAHLIATADPAVSLRLTDDYFHRRRPDTMATALVMIFDADNRSIEIASAGHLAPVMAELGSSAHIVDCGLGPPIGSGLGGYTSMTRSFPANALLIAFTDGLVELRDQTIDESLAHFCRSIDACIEHAREDTPEQVTIDVVIDMLTERAGDPNRTDDAAAVVCRSTASPVRVMPCPRTADGSRSDTVPLMSDHTARLRINRDGGRLVIQGDIDAHTCPDLAAHLDPLTGDGDVQLDLAGVDFMDSSGLRVIIGAHQRATEADRKLIIERPGRSVRRILEISGLIDHLHIVDAD